MDVLCFIFGLLFYLKKSTSLLVAVTLLLWFQWRWMTFLCFIFGFMLAFWHDQQTFPTQEIQTHWLPVEGSIVSVPKLNLNSAVDSASFEFLIEKPHYARVKLSCYQDCPVFKPSQRWRFHIKLKPVRNYRNPGSTDFESSMHAKHIQWIGFIQPKTALYLAEDTTLQSQLLSYRVSLSERFSRVESNYLGIVEALTLGLTHHISSELWHLFRQTGTTHLMVISGAHIALIAGFCFMLLRKIWAFFPFLTMRYPASRIAGLAAMGAGGLYATLSGLGVPAQRAALSFVIASLRYLLSKRFSVWQGYTFAVWMVLFNEPHAVLQPGFYLSFIAVAILLLMSPRVGCLHGLLKGLILQSACLIGLLPFTLYWFSYGSLNGFFANIFAIPWVSFVIIPLSFLLLFFHQVPGISVLTYLSNHAIAILLHYLHWIDTFSWTNLTYHMGSFLSVCFFVIGLFGLWSGLKSTYPVAWLLLCLMVFKPRLWVPFGAFEARVLDVGQGLSVVIHTAHHTLVYDTGLKFYHGSDIGQQVLIPYFKTVGLQKLDAVVVSHPDIDHRGGLKSLRESLQIGTLWVDDPKRYIAAQSCHQAKPWVWDGVHFQFFPILNATRTNNHSCVLKISSVSGELLLTGDIEKKAEYELITRYGKALASSILLVPHHASKTSSSWDFLKIVHPQKAVVSYATFNRYGFPHQQTLNTYRALSIPIRSTAEEGMITLDL